MSLYPSYDLQRDRERTPAILARHHDLAPAPGGRDEALQLTAQRVGARTLYTDSLDQLLQRRGGHRHPCADLDARAQPQELTLPRREIQTQVTRTLEDTELAHPLGR